jgi:hypothetical protein
MGDLGLIRPFGLRDIVTVARLQREVVPLDLEWQLTRAASPLGTALLSHTVPGRGEVSTFIADHREESGRWKGLAQMRQRRNHPEYVITYLGPSLTSREGTHALWQRLLAHAYVQAGEHGAHRVYAGLPPDGEETQLFRHMGFTAYAQEDIFRWHPEESQGMQVVPLALRHQNYRDSWGLQQLYASVTPRAVQNAEGSAQAEWELNHTPWSLRHQRAGLVWDGPGEIAAAVQIRSARRGHWIKLLLHPDAREYASPLVAAALSKVESSPDQSVFCAVRTYESDLASTLRDHGFRLLTSHTLVVKPCTVLARDTLGQIVPSLNGQTEHAAPTAIKCFSEGNNHSL